jgi:16S rRNA A1518/A1519 N6-dimethyltransferase RsmA/KsgA/DIM1 with predicted DNA glycosylase/AP lyase activity
LMYQDEVARKLTAKVGTKLYGRLGVMAQTFCKEIKYVEKVPAHKFTPRPKVDAGIVKFEFDFNAPQGTLKKSVIIKYFHPCFLGIFDDLEKLTCVLFRHRNKKMSLDPQLQINPDWRPHHLSPELLQKILRFQKQIPAAGDHYNE